ncbi:family 43 glycosylhydrolase [Mucilaginibacter sabulilitoris]|uniref:Family 43 glycosylhydrolase n=1 Tax=Mucilaginibacter sabulilitoris TaxID=1173583 RepID=A0ABZ0TWA5_9SPHI|nr:family 43 glycosylhydrolase [Mucilaginibacter sabulilitoris]WPU97167.1 family 43 glycosylhydrolase [Mucilaginibacter sabulilitoris]
MYWSTDLRNWHQSGYLFDKVPDWKSGSFWAQEYYKIKDTYYIYYTTRRKSDNASYISVATSKYLQGYEDILISFGLGKKGLLW